MHKPCPRCGVSSTAISYVMTEHGRKRMRRVRCNQCGAMGPRSNNNEHAGERWDARRDPQQVTAKLAEPTCPHLAWWREDENTWIALSTVYTALQDGDPFHFRIRKWRGIFRIDETNPELIPSKIALAFHGSTVEAAKRTCGNFNRDAFYDVLEQESHKDVD